MNLVLKALVIGSGVFILIYLFGWYIGQEPDVSQWNFLGRYFHVAITLLAIFMTFVGGSTK